MLEQIIATEMITEYRNTAKGIKTIALNVPLLLYSLMTKSMP
jgi:hypothetical protein